MSPTVSNALTVTLPSDREIVLTRVFDAPRRLVFDAMTQAEHVPKWWGPRGTVFTRCEIDCRPGGTWRYELRSPDGRAFAFKGTFHEIQAPERIVATECYDEPAIGSPEWLATVVLEEVDGRTKMTSTILHPSVEARNGHLQSGMEAGASQTFDRLAELLRALK